MATTIYATTQGQVTGLEIACNQGVQSIQPIHADATGVPMITVCPDSALYNNLEVQLRQEHTRALLCKGRVAEARQPPKWVFTMGTLMIIQL